MAGRYQRAVFFVFFTSAFLCASGFADQQHKTHKAAPKKEAVAPQPAPVVPPPPPPTPEQMPATPAQVTYQNSQLTILARNSTVGDILRAVRKQTGATVDAPLNATQRVVGQFGPGPARDVLASVLDASGFNYVLLGSATNPNALQNVIVTVKSNEPTSPTMQQPQQQPSPDASNADDDNQPPEADQPEQAQPSESFAPQQNDSSNNATDDQNSQDQQQQNIKTPEQLLQELQRQQQLQQLQQRQNGQPQGSSTDQMQQNQR